jgi:amino acid transporter
VTTAGAAGVFGSGLLNSLGIWKNQPSWAPILIVGVALALALLLAALPARGGTNVLLVVEVCTVTLILVVTVVVLVRLIGGSAPGGSHFTWSVFSPQSGIGTSGLFLGVVFGFLSFAGFEASSTLGEEARNPSKDIPRAILGVAIFGGVYFVVVTAAEMMGFGTSAHGVAAFSSSPSLLGDLGTSYVGALVIPVAAVIVLGYTLYRNVYPYPSGDAYWFPIVGGAWLAAAVIGVLFAPRLSRKLGEALAAHEGIRTEEDVIGL